MSTTTRPGLDLVHLRNDPDAFRRSQERRGEDPLLVDAALEHDQRRREAVAEGDTLRAQQKQDGRLVKGAAPEERAQLLLDLGVLSKRIKALEEEASEAETLLAEATRRISNLVQDDAPTGGEYSFQVLENLGAIPSFDFPVRDHVEIGTLLGAIDLGRGVKVSGSRFYFLTGQGARLQRALVNLALDTAEAQGRTPVVPPVLVRPEAMAGTGFLGHHASEVYHLPADDLYLVGTSEVPLAAFHAEEILEDQPYQYVAASTCFRREAGSHGRDTRGIFRVHQFEKVELFSFVPQEEAEAEHLRILEAEKSFLELLELPFRVIDVASGDLGSSAARKFDCEAWFPSQERYREVTSTSNCTTYQARRLGIRARGHQGMRPFATVNGTLCATTRIIAAILENHQQADGTVRVPAALQPYLGQSHLTLV